MVFKRYSKTLRDIYTAYTGRFRKPGEAAFMSVEEFLDLAKAANFCNEETGVKDREPRLAFVGAMMTVVNEVKTERHKRMTYVEFLEAIARVAAFDRRPAALSQKLAAVLDRFEALHDFLCEHLE